MFIASITKLILPWVFPMLYTETQTLYTKDTSSHSPPVPCIGGTFSS